VTLSLSVRVSVAVSVGMSLSCWWCQCQCRCHCRFVSLSVRGSVGFLTGVVGVLLVGDCWGYVVVEMLLLLFLN